MSETLELCTPGEWKADGSTIFSTDGHVITYNTGTRHHSDQYKCNAERAANARVMAQSKRMYEVMLKIKSTPLKELVTTNELIENVLSIISEVDVVEVPYERP